MQDRPSASPPDPRSDVSGLRAFVAVARLGTVGRAAHALGRTQPSVSARLAGLEQAWGTRLFRRASRGMFLTPEGRRLLPLAESVLRDLEELDRAAGAPVAEARELRLGAGDALGRRRLPRAVASLLREFPALDVHLREGSGSQLLEALRAGDIDLALIVRPPAGLRCEGLDVCPIAASEVEVLAPPGAGTKGAGPLRLEALAGRRLVSLQPGSWFRHHLEAAFERKGLPFRPAVEVGNLSLVRRFAAAGLGWAPVPAIAFGPRDRGPARRRLRGVQPVTYARAVRAGAPLTPAAERLVQLVSG